MDKNYQQVSLAFCFVFFFIFQVVQEKLSKIIPAVLVLEGPCYRCLHAFGITTLYWYLHAPTLLFCAWTTIRGRNTCEIIFLRLFLFWPYSDNLSLWKQKSFWYSTRHCESCHLFYSNDIKLSYINQNQHILVHFSIFRI